MLPSPSPANPSAAKFTSKGDVDVRTDTQIKIQYHPLNTRGWPDASLVLEDFSQSNKHHIHPLCAPLLSAGGGEVESSTKFSKTGKISKFFYRVVAWKEGVTFFLGGGM